MVVHVCSQEFGQNRRASATKACPHYLQDGKGSANLETRSSIPPATSNSLQTSLAPLQSHHCKLSVRRKIIGARYYLSGYAAEQGTGSSQHLQFKSPRDSEGHGSHTASTAAGRLVKDTSYNGLGAGWARGGAPLARIAVYKTCWDSGCYDADILAAFNDAISDGVDIVSLSLGSDSPQRDYSDDAISIGSFHAASHGILVVASAGNAGDQGTVTNVAPWMLTVGASSTDREFASTIALGNGANFTVRRIFSSP